MSQPFPSAPVAPFMHSYWWGQGDPLYAVVSRDGARPSVEEIARIEETVHEHEHALGDEPCEGGERCGERCGSCRVCEEESDVLAAYAYLLWVAEHCGYDASEETRRMRGLMDVRDYAAIYGWDGEDA